MLKSFKANLLSSSFQTALFLGFFLFSPGCSHAEQAPALSALQASSVVVQFLSQDITDGSLVVLEVTGDATLDETKLEGVFEEKKFSFFKTQKPSVFQGFFAVPFDHAAGEFKVEVKSGATQNEFAFKIRKGDYGSDVLKVDPSRVSPPAKALVRIEKEQNVLNEVYSSSLSEKLWNEDFIFPISAPITSPYGTKRLYNGKLSGHHSGLDLKAVVGTRIQSTARGKVVLTKDLYFTGNTVILDHGLGLFTIYAHLSRMKVHVGQIVEKGGLLGLSGKTGRVTGPHLHWAAQVNRVKFNPLGLIQKPKSIVSK